MYFQSEDQVGNDEPEERNKVQTNESWGRGEGWKRERDRDRERMRQADRGSCVCSGAGGGGEGVEGCCNGCQQKKQ